MQDSKFRSRLKTQLSKFTRELAEGLSKPISEFVGEMLFGIQAGQDVKLSEIFPGAFLAFRPSHFMNTPRESNGFSSAPLLQFPQNRLKHSNWNYFSDGIPEKM